MFILMKTWRSRSDPTTPMAMQNIHPGKNEPSTLMDGAPRQPVRKIKLAAAMMWIFFLVDRIHGSVLTVPDFLFSNCGPRSPEAKASAAVDSKQRCSRVELGVERPAQFRRAVSTSTMLFKAVLVGLESLFITISVTRPPRPAATSSRLIASRVSV